MAAAEAKYGSQSHQTIDGCFFQENFNRAQKLSDSSSSSSKSDLDTSSDLAANVSDLHVQGFMPSDQSPRKPDSLSKTKWWLHPHPYYSQQKKCSHEQLGALESELKVFSAQSTDLNVKFIGETQLIEEYCTKKKHPNTNDELFLDQPWKVLSTCVECNPKEENLIFNDSKKISVSNNLGDIGYEDSFIHLDPENNLAYEQAKRISSDLDFQWIRVEKTEPWRRTADKDELASLVSHKSLELVGNCDLPQPQTKNSGVEAAACPHCSDQEKCFSCLEDMANKEVSTLADCMQGVPTPVSVGKTQHTLGTVLCSPHGSDRSFSDDGLSSTKADNTETLYRSTNDLSKAQLLEALCHSQTRAREAEMAAQAAHDEKEHTIKLFLRQASHLFAYKQWLRILQLETFCLELRTSNQLASNNFPAFLPWVPYKGSKLRRIQRRAAKRKQGPQKGKISKCAVAFALGLSLAGAGLLLGWTMGWLIPAL